MSLDVSALSAGYDRDHTPVLHHIDFTVPIGELAAVLGPSGSGKTTLLRVIAGLHPAAAGSIRLSGRELVGLRPEKRNVGLVPQEGALFSHLTVAGNVGFGLPRTSDREGRVAELLDLVELGGYAERMPHELSGGQAQRIALARALAPRPDLVLLDEPFSSLDATLRVELRDQVRAALRATGTTAVLVTHDQGEALSMADRLIVIDGGRIRQAGPPSEVYAAPADLWTGQFVGEATVLDGVSDGASAHTALGMLRHDPIAPGTVAVLLRPEQVRLGPPIANTIGRVQAVRFFGHDALVEIVIDDGTAISARLAAGEPLPTVGETFGVTVTGAVRAFAPSPVSADPNSTEPDRAEPTREEL